MGKRDELKYHDLAAARRRFCPHCEELLDEISVDNSVPVQQCPRCSAVWLNRNDLGRIRSRARVPGVDEDRLRSLSVPGRRLVCPRCDVRELRRILTPAGFLHRCSRCGGILTPDIPRTRRPLLLASWYEDSREEKILAWTLVALVYLSFFALYGLWHVLFGR